MAGVVSGVHHAVAGVRPTGPGLHALVDSGLGLPERDFHAARRGDHAGRAGHRTGNPGHPRYARFRPARGAGAAGRLPRRAGIAGGRGDRPAHGERRVHAVRAATGAAQGGPAGGVLERRLPRLPGTRRHARGGHGRAGARPRSPAADQVRGELAQLPRPALSGQPAGQHRPPHVLPARHHGHPHAVRRRRAGGCLGPGAHAGRTVDARGRAAGGRSRFRHRRDRHHRRAECHGGGDAHGRAPRRAHRSHAASRAAGEPGHLRRSARQPGGDRVPLDHARLHHPRRIAAAADRG